MSRSHTGYSEPKKTKKQKKTCKRDLQTEKDMLHSNILKITK